MTKLDLKPKTTGRRYLFLKARIRVTPFTGDDGINASLMMVLRPAYPRVTQSEEFSIGLLFNQDPYC